MLYQQQAQANHFSYSTHARKRMQQRAISDTQLKLIEAFGEYRYQKGGSYYAFIPDKYIKELKYALNKIESVRAIYSDNNSLITVMHDSRKRRSVKGLSYE